MGRRKSPKFPYDEEKVKRTLAFIAAGCHPLTAAEAAGIPAEVWEAWLVRRQTPYYALKWRMREAVAQACARAEINVYDENPERWLKYGPGRDGPFRWQSDPRVIVNDKRKQQTNVLIPPEEAVKNEELQRVIMEALKEFPDAKATVAARLLELRRPSVKQIEGRVIENGKK